MNERHGTQRRWGWFAALCLIALGFFCTQPPQPPVTPTPVEVPAGRSVTHDAFQAAISRFEARLAGDVAEDGIGSIAAAVLIGKEVVWARAFGWADVERTKPGTVDSIFRTGSISKSFTAVLMMQMVEKGYFGLDDPVQDYFPEITGLAGRPDGAGPITFRQLASHTSGLSREPRLKGAASGPIAQWEEKILASIPKTEFRALPGEAYSYSNIGFGILGLAVSRAAGKPFMDLVGESIFDPLGMADSFFVLSEGHVAELAMGYSVDRNGSVSGDFPAREHAGRGYKVPNGGIYSTVGDLAGFMAALMGTSPVSILSEESRREILTWQTPEDGAGYGLGFALRKAEDGRILAGHGGSVAGYNAGMLFDVGSQIGVVIFRNYNRGKTNLGLAIRQLLEELSAALKHTG